MKKLFLLAFLVLISCRNHKNEPLPVIGKDAGMSLQVADFAQLKGFQDDELVEALNAMTKSCETLIEKPQFLTQSAIKFDTNAYIKICQGFLKNPPKTNGQMQAFLTKNFKPYKVLYNFDANGKFTSYYEAEIKASTTKHGKYIHPIYGKPADLVEINLQDFDKTLPNKRLVMRVENQKGVPYYTRAEIENNGVDAPVILWADDIVDIYLMQIQGSAVATLDDGREIRVSYADNNGHPFVGIGSILLNKGLLQKGEASMDKIRDWLKNNPQIAKGNMQENRRFIFHRLTSQDGPIGAMGVTLTAGRSLAVDPKYIPLGSMIWLETTDPDKKPLQKLMAAQDIGNAIKGAVRGDYFWGHGEEALLSAGKMNASGQYYILLPKDSGVSIRD